MSLDFPVGWGGGRASIFVLFAYWPVLERGIPRVMVKPEGQVKFVGRKKEIQCLLFFFIFFLRKRRAG